MGLWSKVLGIFGQGDAATTPDGAFVELALSVVRQHPMVQQAELVGGDAMAVRVSLRNGDEHTLFLRNTFMETREVSPEEKRLRVHNLLGFFDDVTQDRPWAEVMTALMPQLRISTFATGQAVGPDLPAAGALLASRAFAPGLRLFLAEDGDSTIRFVTRKELTRWGQEPESALSMAFENLQRHVDAAVDAELYDKAATYPIWIVTRDDSYEASRLALPGYLASFRDKVHGAPIAIAPHRSLLVVSGDGSDQAIQRLCTMAEAEFNASPRSISPALYTVNDADDVVPLQLPPEHPLHTVAARGHYLLQATCYAEQKQQLQQEFERNGVDVFVAKFTLLENETKALTSRAVMTRGVATLLPVVNRVVLVTVVDGKAEGRPIVVPWNELMNLAPECFEPAPEYDPPRLRIVGWPNDATLDELQRRAV